MKDLEIQQICCNFVLSNSVNAGDSVSERQYYDSENIL
jgi:hypothetical protein